MIRNSLICKLINVQASMKENNEKKINNSEEISKLIKAFPKDIAESWEKYIWKWKRNIRNRKQEIESQKSMVLQDISLIPSNLDFLNLKIILLT